MALMSISGARPFGSVFGAEAARRLGVFGLGCDRRWGASAGCRWGGSFWKLRPGCRQCGCAAPVRSSRFWSRMRRSSFWEPAGRPVVKFRLFVANAPFPAIATEPPRLVANDIRAIVAAFASKVRAICVLSFYAYKLFSTLCAKPSYDKRSRPVGRGADIPKRGPGVGHFDRDKISQEMLRGSARVQKRCFRPAAPFTTPFRSICPPTDRALRGPGGSVRLKRHGEQFRLRS